MPAGFQNGDVASSATAANAPPMPTARAPTGILRNSAAYFVAPAGAARDSDNDTASSTRIGFALMHLPELDPRFARGPVSLGGRPINCQPVGPSASIRACSL